MGVADILSTVLLTPAILSVALIQLVTGPIQASTQHVQQAIRKKPQAIVGKRERVGAKRGRLILIPVDETSQNAITWSLSNLLSNDDFVHLLHILQPEDTNNESASFTSSDYDGKKSQIKGLSQFCNDLTQAGITFDGQIRPCSKDMAQVILDVIGEVNPDMVVLAASERTGLQDVGEVARSVALHTTASVTLVK